jgi:hypothetical protein
MTPAQFHLLATLLRSRSVSREACRRVLLLGERQCDVARALNVSPTLIAVSLAKYRRAYEAVLRAFAPHEHQ